jgi:hypothetical protein
MIVVSYLLVYQDEGVEVVKPHWHVSRELKSK